MKKFRMFRVFFLLFAVLFALSGCTGKTTVEQSGNAYTIYYLNTSGIQLVGSEYRTETTDLDALVRELLDKMGNVPADLDCQRALPERIEKITYRIEGNVLYLYADANYALMNSVQEILCRAALTKTLTQIPDIEYLSIYCAEQPITDAAGNPVGMLSASDFVDSIRDVNSFERTELTLYFANEAGEPTGGGKAGSYAEQQYIPGAPHRGTADRRSSGAWTLCDDPVRCEAFEVVRQ